MEARGTPLEETLNKIEKSNYEDEKVHQAYSLLVKIITK